jgi:hypothetical protein
MCDLEELFGPPVSLYTRGQALDDGVLVSAMTPDLAEVTRQHFKFPVAMTAGVAEAIDRAVAHPRHCNDRRGVWHDICWMLNRRIAGLRSDGSGALLFKVIITGAALIGAGDDGEPCLTVLLPDED